LVAVDVASHWGDDGSKHEMSALVVVGFGRGGEKIRREFLRLGGLLVATGLVQMSHCSGWGRGEMFGDTGSSETGPRGKMIVV